MTAIVTPTPRPTLVFIMSPVGRSGTNFLRALMIKSRLCQAPLGHSIASEDWMNANSHLLIKYAASVKQRHILASQAEPMVYELEEAMLLRQFGEAIRNTIRYKHSRPIALKTPSSDGVSTVFNLFDDARLILLIRDGRDTCQSICRSGFIESYAQAFERWRDKVKQMTDYAGVYTENSRPLVLWVKYEDAFADPEATVRRIARFIGEGDAKLDMNGIRELPVFGSSELGRTPKDEFVYQTLPVKRGFNPIGRWKSWPPEVKKLFKKIANEQLVDLGYEKDESW
jgi:hypothetical protein